MTRRFASAKVLLLATWMFSAVACGPARAVAPDPTAALPLSTETPQADPAPPTGGPVETPAAGSTVAASDSPVPLPGNEESPSPPGPATLTPQPECGKDWCVYPGHFFLQKPVVNLAHRWIDPTYRYGSTASGSLQPHTGVEFQAPAGTPVLAAATGRVAAAGDGVQMPFPGLSEEYGNLVVLEHRLPGLDVPVFSLYGHLDSISVRAGQEVNAGDPLGFEGATGIATGPHLHFEVRVGSGSTSTPRNPELWTAPPKQPDGQASGALAGRICGVDGEPVPSAVVTVQFTGEPGAVPSRQFYLETYATANLPGDDLWQENFAAGDLVPGWYRITFIGNGKLYERLVPVFPGQVTIASEIRETR